MKLLGGSMVTHNCIEYDYNFMEVAQCLLEVCDEVAIVDGNSTDGTLDRLKELQARHPNLKLGHAKWDPPNGPDFTWLDNICEQAKGMLTTPMHLFLCADEVVDKSEYGVIRCHAQAHHTVVCKRYTFWGGESDLYLPNENPVRIGPIKLKCVGAAGELEHKGTIRDTPPVHIYHYGFLRDQVALATKQRKLQMANHNQYDAIFDAVEKEGAKALTDARFSTAVPRERLKKLTGPHPEVMHKWLKEHGYHV